MARTYIHPPGTPRFMSRRKRYHSQDIQKQVEHRSEGFCRLSTSRSASLLLALPLEILSIVFRHALEESIALHARAAPFFRFLELRLALQVTEPLARVCTSWFWATRSVYFGSAILRDRILYRVRPSHLPRLRQIFPYLKDCALDLGDPNRLPELDQTRALLRSLEHDEGSLDFITAITLEDNPRNLTAGHPPSLMKDLCDELQSVYGISLPTCELSDVGGMIDFPGDDNSRDRFPRPDRALTEGLSTHLNSLSYYHAHIFREVLCHLPQLSYLEVPAHMLPPLLLETYPESKDPPQNSLQRFDISYENYGRSLTETAKSIQFLQIVALPQPLYAVFPHIATSRDFFEPTYEHWADYFKHEIEPQLKERTKDIFGELGTAQGTYNNIHGLAYRGTEVIGNDSDAATMNGLKHFKSGNLQQFHFVSNGVFPHERSNRGLSTGDALDIVFANGYRTLTSLTIDVRPSNDPQSSRHQICELLAGGTDSLLPYLKALDVTLPSICPVLVEGLSQRLVSVGEDKGGRWTIRTEPEVCQQHSDTAGCDRTLLFNMTLAEMLEMLRSCETHIIPNFRISVQQVSRRDRLGTRSYQPILDAVDIAGHRGPKQQGLLANSDNLVARMDNELKIKYSRYARPYYPLVTSRPSSPAALSSDSPASGERTEEYDDYLIYRTFTEEEHRVLERIIMGRNGVHGTIIDILDDIARGEADSYQVRQDDIWSYSIARFYPRLAAAHPEWAMDRSRRL